MKRRTILGKPPFSADVNAEISALIEILHRTERRLKELTDGEMDTVADRDNRTLLSRRAQDHMRHNEAVSRVSILNALSANIAMLDSQGLVLSVNEAWRKFADTNGLQSPEYGIGLNYLTVCDRAYGEDVSAARQAAEGIRSVLGGEVKSFAMEYSCHSPTEQRWFLMTVTPLADDSPQGVVVMHSNITDIKQADERAHQLAERLTTTLESITDAFFTVDREWRFTFLNREAERLLARTGVELNGQVLWTEFPDTIGSTFEREYRRAIEDNQSVEFEEFYPPLDTWFGVHAYPSEQGLAVYFSDIGARKQAADELRESQNLLRLVVEKVPARIFWKDRNLRYLGCNTRFAQDAGYSRPDELTGKTDFEMGWKDQAELYRGDDKAVLESGTAKLEIEEPQTSPDGNTIWLSTSKVPLRDKDNQIIGILGLYQDITASKKVAQELLESERRFSELLENVELISVMLDREARITYCNEYLLQLTGWRRKEIIGCSWFDIFMPPGIPDLKDVFFEVLLAEQPGALHHENEILTRSGERRLIRWNNLALRSGAGDVIGTASIGEDITERMAAEGRIADLNRVYAMLSGINTLIVRVSDRDELFQEACRIAVEEGGFIMSMLGVVDRNSMKLTQVVSAGVDDQLLSAVKNLLSSDKAASTTLVAQAIREKQAVVSNDSQNDPKVLLGKQYVESGVRSMAIFPLIVADEAVGVFALYASERDFFQKEEIKLLAELTSDISFAIDHIEKSEKLNYLAYYDALTGLANRSLFLDRVNQYMNSATNGGHQLALILIDLERFKNINDSLGRSVGDALLMQVAEWLAHNAGGENLLARVGADHFAIVLPEIAQVSEVARFLEKTMKSFLSHPFRLNDTVFRGAAKAGVALFPDDAGNADELFRNAEAALKRAKASGDRYLFYTQKMTATVASNVSLENQLRQALDNEEFVLYYQPKVNLVSGKLTSAEALIRWNDPRTGLVPPGKFIPILEETGLIYEVGRWALRRAIADYLRWLGAGLPAVRIAVNVSPLQLRNLGFTAEIEQVIDMGAHAAAGLELEITESLIMSDIAHNIASLQAIRAMGVTIAIDDFGTGFSSLSYLSRLPVDTLKIDRTFVIDMTTGPEGLALMATIINLAHSMKLNVVAEGVETEEQSRLLRLLDCDEMQGYLFSEPVPCEIFETRFLAPPPVG